MLIDKNSRFIITKQTTFNWKIKAESFNDFSVVFSFSSLIFWDSSSWRFLGGE